MHRFKWCHSQSFGCCNALGLDYLNVMDYYETMDDNLWVFVLLLLFFGSSCARLALSLSYYLSLSLMRNSFIDFSPLKCMYTKKKNYCHCCWCSTAKKAPLLSFYHIIRKEFLRERNLSSFLAFKNKFFLTLKYDTMKSCDFMTSSWCVYDEKCERDESGVSWKKFSCIFFL